MVKRQDKKPKADDKNSIRKSCVDIRQERVAERLMENNGKKKSVSRIMREEGYSENYSKNPQTLVNSKTFQKILNKKFDDKRMVEIQNEVLEKPTQKETAYFDLDLKNTDIKNAIEKAGGEVVSIMRGKRFKTALFYTPDYRVKQKALEMIFKLKGHLKDNIVVEDEFSALRDMTMADLMAEYKRELGKMKK